LSPDGRYLAFLVTDDTENTSLWLRAMDSLIARPLPGTERASGQFWSPDSRFLAFFADGKLKKIDVAGGAPSTICDASLNSTGSWSSTGDILFGAITPRGPIKRVSNGGGVPVDITTLSSNGTERHGYPFFLPDGRHFLYLAVDGPGGTSTMVPQAIFAASLDSNESRRVLDTGSNVAFSDGYLLFVREGALMARPFDARRLEFTGDAETMIEGVAVAANAPYIGTFSTSRTGLLVYQASPAETRTQLTWYDRSGRALRTVGKVGDFSDPELSPDGERIAVSVFDPVKKSRDIWIYDANGDGESRLTIDFPAATTPRWSSDGANVFFSSIQNGIRDVYRKNSRGTGPETVVVTDAVEKFLADFSPDGKYLLYQSGTGGAGARLFLRPLQLDGKSLPSGFVKGNEYWGRFSPDGKWIAYYSNVSGRREVWVTRFPFDGSRWQVTTDGAWFPRWRRDGRELFYLGFDNTIYAMPVNGSGAAFQFGLSSRLFQFQPRYPFIPYDVTADGQRFIVTSLLEEPEALPITVVVNWPDDLLRH
jgi:Tol biopolymer transport system component